MKLLIFFFAPILSEHIVVLRGGIDGNYFDFKYIIEEITGKHTFKLS